MSDIPADVPAKPQFFAVVPAAGRSRRMGQPKLLMAFQGRPLIARVLETWLQCGLAGLVVVAHPEDHDLHAVVREMPAAQLVLPPIAPPQMKDSVQAGLDWIATHQRPAAQDAWLLAPADFPGLSVPVIRTLLDDHSPLEPHILVPEFQGRHGHPVLFPWCWRDRLTSLPADQGINALLAQLPTRAVPTLDPWVLEDVDTPADYRRLHNLNAPDNRFDRP